MRGRLLNLYVAATSKKDWGCILRGGKGLAAVRTNSRRRQRIPVPTNSEADAFGVKYKNYDEVYEEKQWWRLPFVSDFLFKGSLGSTLTMALGSESLNTTQFVQSAFGLMKPFNLPSSNNWEPRESLNPVYSSSQAPNQENENDSHVPLVNDADGNNYVVEQRANGYIQSEYFWKSFINQAVFQKLGVSLPEIKSWDGLDLLDKMSTQLRRWICRRKMEVILGALMVLATPLSKQKNDLISLYSYKNEEPSNEKGNDNSDNEIAVGEMVKRR
ncbi:hypothetical protein KSP39_PZI020350 [Platanthera zijinensis]|uniref:Uncharacterized protein n=1 Tax=Platanthera zijinensis TaxID=2320716 RepID=A0AAP0B0C6_9ASPA